jgi:NitT/TauT family transport system substrate-binding protein
MTRWLLAAALSLCIGGSPPASWAAEAKRLRIVKQPGLGYLPFIVMREQKLLEKHAPGVAVEWLQLTSGPVIRDAMIAGQIDIGSGGFPPFVQAIEKGLSWKAIGALNEMPLFLNCGRPGIRSLKDLLPTDRIALPAIGSIQHLALEMEAEKELGDAKKLNQQIVSMSQGDATAALLSHREITCHLSGPPFQYEQLRDPGIAKVFDSYQAAGGPHTFNMIWTSEAWARDNPALLASFIAALREAMELIAQKPAEAARLYVQSEKSKSTAEEVQAIIGRDGIRYTITPKGLYRFASFMLKVGMIKSVRPSWRDYVLPHLHAQPGS